MDCLVKTPDIEPSTQVPASDVKGQPQDLDVDGIILNSKP